MTIFHFLCETIFRFSGQTTLSKMVIWSKGVRSKFVDKMNQNLFYVLLHNNSAVLATVQQKHHTFDVLQPHFLNNKYVSEHPSKVRF
jgi:hypothetical protein